MGQFSMSSGTWHSVPAGTSCPQNWHKAVSLIRVRLLQREADFTRRYSSGQVFTKLDPESKMPGTRRGSKMAKRWIYALMLAAISLLIGYGLLQIPRRVIIFLGSATILAATIRSGIGVTDSEYYRGVRTEPKSQVVKHGSRLDPFGSTRSKRPTDIQ